MTNQYSVPPQWADEYIAALQRGETVEFRPRGRSMEPLVMDNELVRVEPFGKHVFGEESNMCLKCFGEQGFDVGNKCPQGPEVGDIVLVTVDERQYFHKIVDIIPETPVGSGGDPAEYVIGNNRGKINGRVWRGDIHGKRVPLLKES